MAAPLVANTTNASDIPQAGENDYILHRKIIPNPNLDSAVDPSRSFTITSYNVLADCHAQRTSYPCLSAEHLSAEFRNKRILQELQYHNSDIICMQEVSPEFFSIAESALKIYGYEGMFKKRIDDWLDEGEATFYKTSRFTLITHRGIALKDLTMKELQSSGLEGDKLAAVQASLDKPSVVLVSQLRCHTTGSILSVANIHVRWDRLPKFDFQCIEVSSAIGELVALAEGCDNPHVICGDFNSGPETPTYQLTKDGFLNDTSITTLQSADGIQMPDGSTAVAGSGSAAAGFSRNSKEDLQNPALVNLWRAGFQHPSKCLRSAYDTVLNEEPQTTRRRQTDIIWYSSTSLTVGGVLEPAPKPLLSSPGIPNGTFPSDHLSLKAQLAFK